MEKITLSSLQNDAHSYLVWLAIDDDHNLYCSVEMYSWAYDSSNNQYYVHSNDVHNIDCETYKATFID